MFDDLDTRSILDRVPAKLKDEDGRALWRRLDSEFSSGGVPAIESYVKSQFDQIRASVRETLAAARNSTRIPGK